MKIIDNSLEFDEKHEQKRIKFANYLRTKNDYHLRAIAQAFRSLDDELESAFQDTIFQYKDYTVMLHRELEKHELEGYVIHGRQISAAQARVIYEMVFEGKYGGLDGKDKTSQGLALFEPTSKENINELEKISEKDLF